MVFDESGFWWKWFLMKVVFWWNWFLMKVVFDESGFWWKWFLMKIFSDESGFDELVLYRHWISTSNMIVLPVNVLTKIGMPQPNMSCSVSEVMGCAGCAKHHLVIPSLRCSSCWTSQQSRHADHVVTQVLSTSDHASPSHPRAVPSDSLFSSLRRQRRSSNLLLLFLWLRPTWPRWWKPDWPARGTLPLDGSMPLSSWHILRETMMCPPRQPGALQRVAPCNRDPLVQLMASISSCLLITVSTWLFSSAAVPSSTRVLASICDLLLLLRSNLMLCFFLLGHCSLLRKTRICVNSQWLINVFVLDDWSVSPHNPQPPRCERSSGAQNDEWGSPRCGFPGDRQIRPLAERIRKSSGSVLLCAQHNCLSHSRCSDSLVSWSNPSSLFTFTTTSALFSKQIDTLFTIMMSWFLASVLSARFMTLITLLLVLDLVLTESSSWVLVNMLAAAIFRMRFLLAVGDALFTRCWSALFTCCWSALLSSIGYMLLGPMLLRPMLLRPILGQLSVGPIFVVTRFQKKKCQLSLRPIFFSDFGLFWGWVLCCCVLCVGCWLLVVGCWLLCVVVCCCVLLCVVVVVLLCVVCWLLVVGCCVLWCCVCCWLW